MANTNVQTAANDREFTSSVQFLTVTAIFVALTYIFTAFINVRLPIAANGGLIHLGNVPLFIGAIIFGKKTGGIARPRRKAAGKNYMISQNLARVHAIILQNNKKRKSFFV